MQTVLQNVSEVQDVVSLVKGAAVAAAVAAAGAWFWQKKAHRLLGRWA